MSDETSPRYRRFPRYDDSERGPDNRTPGQRDRDRILYTTAFRRLVGVTQVASASEGPTFHNRLTHSLEVAQIARRIAELLTRPPAGVPVQDHAERVASLGGLDPDVVEAAALAHDLGHPPYGHIGEEELDAKVTEVTGAEGFEGNAQTFRIVTRLAIRHERFTGLNLTRATLNGILKYPWRWVDRPSNKPNKWGAYEEEAEFLRFARELDPPGSQVQGLEAAIMDWADDIAYAVHDVEDFYRAGLIPLETLTRGGRFGEMELDRFVSGIFARYANRGKSFPYTESETRLVAERVVGDLLAPIEVAYDGTPGVRSRLRTLTATSISRYVQRGARLGKPDKPLAVDSSLQKEVTILKELTWHYVIDGPQLATQQSGQRRIVRDLFDVYHDAISGRKWWLLPAGFRAVVERSFSETADETSEGARLTADFVAGLTEDEAVQLHRRITGVESGHLLDALARGW